MSPFRLMFVGCLGLCLAFGPAMARSAKAAPVPSGETLDISADESLEWYQDQKLYVARGKARAVKGESVVEADILTAKQKDGPREAASKETNGAVGDLDYLTAEGHVKISDPRQQVFGDRAVYDLKAKSVKITGSNLKYLTEKDVVTARDSLEYFEDRDMAVARGRAVAEHARSRIEADVLTAHFSQGTSGQKELSDIEAQGHVVILTKDGGVSRGDRGSYDAKKDRAILMDHVRITRGETQLAGDRAEVDFATGQSRLLNSGSGRVRALLPAGKKEGKTSP